MPSSLPVSYCQGPWCFTDVTLASGIDPGVAADPFELASPAAFLDYDADGWLDVLVGSGDGPIALYRSLGDGSFVDVTAQAGLDIRASVATLSAFVVADYDNDGLPDIYVTTHGPNLLLHNHGMGGFEDVSPTAGVSGTGWSAGAVFGDYDGDGLLDLYVANYIATINYPDHTAEPNVLYRNLGGGSFEDVTEAAGVGGAGTSFSATFFDLEDDGDLDLMVCNDFGMHIEPNRLYRNDGPAAPFAEISASVGADADIYCMGSAVGDVDGDLDLDFYFTNIGRNVLLSRESSDGGYVDVTDEFGIDLTYEDCNADALYVANWGAVFRDLNLDGSLDLLVTGGWIPGANEIANSEDTPDTLFAHNFHSNTFSDVSIAAGVADEGIGRTVALGDYDNDGDLDILHHGVKQKPILLRNDTLGGGSVTLRLRGSVSNRDAIGARVIADVAGRRILREVRLHDGFGASHPGDILVGLGDAAGIEALEIRWPSGGIQQLGPVPAGDTLLIVEAD